MRFIHNGDDFRLAIGAFIIAFSEVEFGLSMIAAMALANDPRKRNNETKRAMAMSITEKRETIKKYIKTHIPELLDVWGEVNHKIGELNKHRRFLTHGHTQFFEPHGYISPVIADKGKLIRKHITIDEIEGWTDELEHLISGKYGVQGEFGTMFSISRINLWNSQVPEEDRMVFRMNGKVLTDWSRGEG